MTRLHFVPGLPRTRLQDMTNPGTPKMSSSLNELVKPKRKKYKAREVQEISSRPPSQQRGKQVSSERYK